MRSTMEEVPWSASADALAASLARRPGTVFLRTGLFDRTDARYSLVTTQPFLEFQSFGTRCITRYGDSVDHQFGDPWDNLGAWIDRFELKDEPDVPFPLGGVFGSWGYDLRQFVEPRVPHRAVNDLELPDCQVGFYASLVVFDHRLQKCWIIATGLDVDGVRCPRRAEAQFNAWKRRLARAAALSPTGERPEIKDCPQIRSSMSQSEFLSAVRRAQAYIRAGHIYQVNLAQRLSTEWDGDGWELFQHLADASPAPYSAYFHHRRHQLCSSSPELFLRISGRHVITRPIKGTRPRSTDPVRDAQLTYELQTSTKEMSELVMITDLLRNDLGRICEYGSVQVPELVRLERYAQVQHLVSTIEGRLRPEVTHLGALASAFPGGSITGAPKIRAMEIIDELEPVTRGPYCGCHGYLGFNQESQISISIRTSVMQDGHAYYHAGAGIVADSDPESEYEETMAKARGWLAAIGSQPARTLRTLSQTDPIGL